MLQEISDIENSDKSRSEKNVLINIIKNKYKQIDEEQDYQLEKDLLSLSIYKGFILNGKVGVEMDGTPAIRRVGIVPVTDSNKFAKLKISKLLDDNIDLLNDTNKFITVYNYGTIVVKPVLDENGHYIFTDMVDISKTSDEADAVETDILGNNTFFKTFVYDENAPVNENVHKLLDLGGFTPLSIVSEGANTIMYLSEGDNESAAISALSAIPGMKVIMAGQAAIKLIPESKIAIGFIAGLSKEIKFGEQIVKEKGKKVLQKNITYTSAEGYKYVTDDMGRISSVEAKIQLGQGKRNPYAQQHVGGNDRLDSDDGGHLIAAIFKGSGDIDNLVPMDSTLNRSDYKRLENTWKRALQDKKEVCVQIKPSYDGESKRPISFNIKYTIDGVEDSLELFN